MSIVQTPTTAANFADQASAYALAIRVLAPRFRQLTREDKADFAALAAEFASADTEEKQLETINAMMEVLDGPVGTIARLDLELPAKQPEGYENWVKWISKHIRDARLHARLTQEQLAEKSGLPQSHISRIENAKHSPSHATLQKIAAALGVPVEHFDLT